MRRPVLALAIALLTVLGACGGSDDPAPSGGGATTSSSGTGSTKAAVDPCTGLTVQQVGPVLGGNATVKDVPGGGCGFDQDDPRAPSVGFFAVSAAGGGFDASKSGVVVDGKVTDVPGVADGAWLAVGTSGGDNLQGQGVVAIGDTLVNISLTQAKGLDRATVTEMMNDLISLVGTLA